MEREQTIQTGLRISESLNEKVIRIAEDCDISKNSAIKMLIGMGIKAYENLGAILQPE